MKGARDFTGWQRLVNKPKPLKETWITIWAPEQYLNILEELEGIVTGIIYPAYDAHTQTVITDRVKLIKKWGYKVMGAASEANIADFTSICEKFATAGVDAIHLDEPYSGIAMTAAQFNIIRDAVQVIKPNCPVGAGDAGIGLLKPFLDQFVTVTPDFISIQSYGDTEIGVQSAGLRSLRKQFKKASYVWLNVSNQDRDTAQDPYILLNMIKYFWDKVNGFFMYYDPAQDPLFANLPMVEYNINIINSIPLQLNIQPYGEFALGNDSGTTTTWMTDINFGKWFFTLPIGAIWIIDMYARNTGVIDGTIKINFRHRPDSQDILPDDITITVPALATGGWYNTGYIVGTYRLLLQRYPQLYVYIKEISANVSYGYDEIKPYDSYTTIGLDMGKRAYIRLYYASPYIDLLKTQVMGTVDVHTAYEDNIMIDALRQSAYTERQSTLSNNGAAAGWVSIIGNNRRGKFFPRGARGFLRQIEIYCQDTAAAGGTIYIFISPQPYLDRIWTGTIVVPLAGAAAWRTVDINRFWNYDSLFIWAYSNVATIQLGVDDTGVIDQYTSADVGTTWTKGAYRYWYRAIYAGETVGDIPISGTVNTVELPSVATEQLSAGVNVPDSTETVVIAIDGSGTLVRAKLRFEDATAPAAGVYWIMFIYVDGVRAVDYPNLIVTQSVVATGGRCPIGVFVQTADVTYLELWLNLKFKRRIEIRAYQVTGGAVQTFGYLTVNRLT